ncbi:MAG: ATP-binding protein [Alphaproteobacteria bacterium]
MAVIIALCIILPWQVSHWVRQIALDEIAVRSHYTLKLVVQNLGGELAKYRYQPQLLSNIPNFKLALSGQATPELLKTVNLELERINNVTGALDTYLMDANGLTIAASNWNKKKPFIGRNFNFRPYFQAAMQGRLGRYYALGTTSNKRGYYFAYPVYHNSNIIGAVVVKVQIGYLEKEWRTSGHEVLVVDPNGVVFLSSKPEWRFRTLKQLPASTVKELKDSQQYSNRNLLPLPIAKYFSSEETYPLIKITANSKEQRQNGGPRHVEYLVTDYDMKDADWKVMLLTETKDIRWQVNMAMIGVGLLMATLILVAANLYQRRKRIQDRIAMQDGAKKDLERRVSERTAELIEANYRLTKEIQVRGRAEEELLLTQSELVQATKLAALGQLSAGLSHELNQPLAAIRNYADNARAFIERGDTKTTFNNLMAISELIARMSRIINNLRTYARDEPIATRPVLLSSAIDSALNLLGVRIKTEHIMVHYDPKAADVYVLGGEVRLQQVFVNLLSNSLDAVSETLVKEIYITVSRSDGYVAIHIRDTGAGIPEGQHKNVFDPFFSTKETGQGMGLGLSITYGLVTQFGGTINAANHDDGGAVFVVILKETMNAVQEFS